MQLTAKRSLISKLGPGLLYAGAAVGVSHLVQSTKAGALFGYGLVWAVLAANLLKYPFFEAGPRYAAATGKSLLHGYRKLGVLPLAIFMIMTICTMFIIQAAVTIVTAGLAIHLTGIQIDAWLMSGIILVVCMALLIIGKYKFLDGMMKIVILLLSVTTVICVAVGLSGGTTAGPEGTSFAFDNVTHVGFLIALMGWMPAPLDISVWHSVWSTAKDESDGQKTSIREALFDFKVGYWGTMGLAICFVALGAIAIYGTDTVIEDKSVPFAAQMIQMYVGVFAEMPPLVGTLMYFMVAIAALTTMFSTTLTCLDAFPRVLTPTTQLLTDSFKEKAQEKRLYWFWISLVVLGAIGLLLYLHLAQEPMAALISFITILSFLLAPVIALFNYLVVTGKEMPEAHRPGMFMRILSLAGMVFLVGFCVFYLMSL